MASGSKEFSGLELQFAMGIKKVERESLENAFFAATHF